VAVVAETTTEVLLNQNQYRQEGNMKYNRQRDGIARVQGFVAFVKNGKVGNKVKVKVTEVADRFSKTIIVG
jgi:hypothetical protein